MAIPTIMVITHSIILGVMAHDDFTFEWGPCIYSGGTALIPWAAYIFSIFKVFFSIKTIASGDVQRKVIFRL